MKQSRHSPLWMISEHPPQFKPFWAWSFPAPSLSKIRDCLQLPLPAYSSSPIAFGCLVPCLAGQQATSKSAGLGLLVMPQQASASFSPQSHVLSSPASFSKHSFAPQSGLACTRKHLFTQLSTLPLPCRDLSHFAVSFLDPVSPLKVCHFFFPPLVFKALSS